MEKIKQIIVKSYNKIKDKFKRDDILYKIITSKDNGYGDIFQIYKNNDLIYETKINKLDIKKSFCFYLSSFKWRNNNLVAIDDDVKKFDLFKNNKINIEYNPDLKKLAFKDMPLPTRFIIDENTFTYKNYKNILQKSVISVLYLPIHITLYIIFYLSLLISYIPIKIYCKNLYNNTIKNYELNNQSINKSVKQSVKKSIRKL